MTNDYLIREATTSDVQEIHDLLTRYYVGNLTIQQRETGFISVLFTLDQIEEMVNGMGTVVACTADNTIVGVTCASPLSKESHSEVIRQMCLALETHPYNGRPVSAYRIAMYGPVCIDRPHMGHGLAEQLFRKCQAILRTHFDLGVLFIDKNNQRSLTAHIQKLGMTYLGDFRANEHPYALVTFTL